MSDIDTIIKAAAEEIVNRYTLWTMATQKRRAEASIGDVLRRHFAGLEAERWRPIKTAPKDGSHIILWRRDIQAVGYYGAGCNDWVVVSLPACLFRHLGSRDTTPTHWMPLPLPPKEAEHD